MWLSKPVYDALPYYYVALGAVALIARLYVDWWYWPTICLIVGVLAIAAGVLVWVKRLRSRRAD
jgi:Flp pilus assembly protein TadB